jgi:hypothetical protein
MATPFELRYQVLDMARSLLLEEFYVKREAVMEKWRAKCSDAERCGANNPEMPEQPSFPTNTEIIKRAEELNGFISKKDST